ncbi:MAG TPA: hypothetical protein V6D18_18855 [Thermosynechococcaceae cyanobacterium]
MSYDPISSRQSWSAPCIIDAGTIVSKEDILRLLSDLNRVRYIHKQDGITCSEGEGCVLEVFADPQRSTLIANHALYLNVHSFDYMQLGQSPDQEPWFDLVQDDRHLRLIPLSNPLQESYNRNLNVAALEAMVAEVLSASWDVQIDDEEHFSF